MNSPLYHLGFSAPAAKTDRVVVLLSDGFHNTPPAHVPFVPLTAYSAAQKSFAQVRTVAMGPDGSVGTQLLADIATEFAGTETFVAKYNQVTDFAGLLNAYLEQPARVRAATRAYVFLLLAMMALLVLVTSVIAYFMVNWVWSAFATPIVAV